MPRTVCVLGAAWLILTAAEGGWPWIYLVELPRQHSLQPESIASFWSEDVLPVFALPLVAGLVFLVACVRRGDRVSNFWDPEFGRARRYGLALARQQWQLRERAAARIRRTRRPVWPGYERGIQTRRTSGNAGVYTRCWYCALRNCC